MTRRLTREEEAEIREIHHIITSDMTVDAGPAVQFVLGLAGDAIKRVLTTGVIIAEDVDD